MTVMRPMKDRSSISILLTILALLFVCAGLADCKRRPGGTQANPAQGTPSPARNEPTPRSAFERDMQYVRNSQFAHVWVFSRKDGRPLDKDDAAYLRANAPQVIDWVTTDEGRKVIAGTNFDLEQGNLNLLRKRFVVEDYTGK
jgi:hypothetical protein